MRHASFAIHLYIPTHKRPSLSTRGAVSTDKGSRPVAERPRAVSCIVIHRKIVFLSVQSKPLPLPMPLSLPQPPLATARALLTPVLERPQRVRQHLPGAVCVGPSVKIRTKLIQNIYTYKCIIYLYKYIYNIKNPTCPPVPELLPLEVVAGGAPHARHVLCMHIHMQSGVSVPISIKYRIDQTDPNPMNIHPTKTKSYPGDRPSRRAGGPHPWSCPRARARRGAPRRTPPPPTPPVGVFKVWV